MRHTLALALALALIGSGCSHEIPGAPVRAPAEMKLFVDPYSPATRQAVAWQSDRPTDAALMNDIAAQPRAFWFVGSSGDITMSVSTLLDAAQAANATPVLVAYFIPQRDCGSYSSGGADSPEAYTAWIEAFARGLNHRSAIVVLEPDAVAQTGCLSPEGLRTRQELLAHAIRTLKAQRAKVYLDAGHPGWVEPHDMAGRLQAAGIANADGFALNVSNFASVDENRQYGDSLSQLLTGKHYVIDTSRNGQGANGEWCNPSGRGLGPKPQLQSGSAVDAYLWIKFPGESDGTCAGGPPAGAWWPEYALGLAERAYTG